MLNFGKESTVQALGRTFKLKRLELAEIRAFRDWIEAEMGDYAAIADRYVDKLPPDKAMALVKEVSEIRKQLKGFTLQCPIAQEYLKTESGIAKMIHLLLAKHHPDATEDDAFAIVIEAGTAALAQKLVEAQGDTPGNAPAPA